jgi:hypothetical protein
LNLQRTAGNAAVARLLSVQRHEEEVDGPGFRRLPNELQAVASIPSTVTGETAERQLPVQRVLATKPSDLDRLIGSVDVAKGIVGRVTKNKDTFATIRGALADYRGVFAHESKIAAVFGPTAYLEWQLDHLGLLDVLCTRFLNEHPQDEKRRQIIERLHDEVTSERVAVSRKGSEHIYQGNVEASDSPDRKSGDAGKRFGFSALSDPARGYGVTKFRKEQRAEMKEKYGLSDAEFSAILIYSAQDFQYINPATANSISWLNSNRDKTPNESFAKVQDKSVFEEGSLHAAMAMQGLAKLPRYTGEAYRGARLTPKQFTDKFSVGNKVYFPTLTSSSFSQDVAGNFMFGLDSGTPPAKDQTVASLAIYTDAGADISRIALLEHEKEVLIRAGSLFQVTSVEKVDANVEFAAKYEDAASRNKPLPEECYIVRLSRIDAPNAT